MVVRGDEGQERNGKDALNTKNSNVKQHQGITTHPNDGPTAAFDPNQNMPTPNVPSLTSGTSSSTSAQAEAAAASAMSIGERVALKRRMLSTASWHRLADGVPHVRQTYNWWGPWGRHPQPFFQTVG